MILTSHSLDLSYYPDGSLSLSKRIPSEYAKRWASDETLTILPSLPLSWAVFFIVSKSRCVKRKWPIKGHKKVQGMSYIICNTAPEKSF